MKKLFALALAALMVLSMAACSAPAAEETAAPATEAPAAEAAEAACRLLSGRQMNVPGSLLYAQSYSLFAAQASSA